MITHFLRLALAHTLAPFTFNRWEPGELDLQVENLEAAIALYEL